MTQWRTKASVSVRSLLELERQIAPLPDATRERFMVRARGTLLALGAVRTPPARMTRRIVPWAAAALVGLVCLGSAAGGFAAYRWCFRRPVAAVRLIPSNDAQSSSAEEREALRIRALVGLGRRDEARRAAAAFRTRFPKSLLVPIVSELAASGS